MEHTRLLPQQQKHYPALHPCPSIPPPDAAPYKTLCCLHLLLIKTTRTSRGLDNSAGCTGRWRGQKAGGRKGGGKKRETSRKPGDFQKPGFNLFRNGGDLAKLRCAPGILEAQPAFNTGASSRHRICARAGSLRVSSPFLCPGRAEGLGGGLKNKTKRMLSHFPAPYHFPGRLPEFLLVKYLSRTLHFSQLGGAGKTRREKRRKIPKLSHYTFFSLSRFCSALGVAEGARLVVQCSLGLAHKSTYKVDFLPFLHSPAQRC